MRQSHEENRAKEIGRAGAALLALAWMFCGVGCSDVQMKSTPIWDEDYAKAIGPAQDRVNLWPVLYWRNPALSVLWPLITVTDQGNGVAAIYEYRKAEGDLRVGTPLPVAPPLAHFIGKDDYQRVLTAGHDGKGKELWFFPLYDQSCDPKDPSLLIVPAFYHDKNGTWTPLYADMKVDSDARLQGVLGPMFNRYKSPKLTQWNLPWPLAGWWTGKDKNGGKLFPAFYYDHDGKDRTFNVGGVLFHREWDGKDNMAFYPWPLVGAGHEGDKSWNYCFPLWIGRRDANESRFYSLPLVRTSDGRSTATLAMLNLYDDLNRGDSRYQAWAWPLVQRFSNAKGSGHAVAPLYATWLGRDGTRTFYSAPFSWSDDGLINFGVVLFHMTDKNGRLHGAALWPLAQWWRDANEQGSAVAPLYYWNRRGDESLLVTPLGGWSRSPRASTTDVLGPLWIDSETSPGQKSFRAACWPLWMSGRAYNRRWSLLLPAYYWSREGDRREFHSIPLSLASGPDRSGVGMMLDLIGWSRRQGKNPGFKHHVFPLYDWSSTPDRASLSLGTGLLADFSWNRRDEASLRAQIADELKRRLKTSSPKPGRPAHRTAIKPLFDRELLLFANSAHENLEGKLAPLADDASTSPGQEVVVGPDGRRWRVVFEKRGRNRVPLAYDHRFDGSDGESMEIFWRLYDSRTTPQKDGSTAVRQRVLWRAFHREAQGGRVSTDVFPFIAYDRDEKAGWMQWSFAGGLVGYKSGHDARTARLLYVPIPLGKPQARRAENPKGR
jgi:hypothetical protein